MGRLDFITIFMFLISFCKGLLGRVAPDYIHTCPGLTSECLQKTIQDTIPYFIKGIPEFGIAPLDPIIQDNLKLNLPGGLKVELVDGRITGIRKCIVDNVKYENYHADINLHCRLTLKGKYRAHGKILIMHLNGDGDAKVKVSNVSLSAKISFEDKERNGTVYHEIKDISIKHKFVDRVFFEMTNLFKGNPEISDGILKFMNENWKIIIEEFGDPIINIVVEYVVDNINKFFTSIPKDEIIVYK